MRWWLIVALGMAGCGPGTKPAAGQHEQQPPPPPAADAPVTRGDAQPPPVASDHGCPDGAVPTLERSNPGEALHSCVVPGKDYRNTPHRHGPYELVGSEGQVLLLGAWRDNKQHGRWRWWNARGVLRREMTYDGVPLSDASWDEDGKPINRRVGQHSVSWHPNGRKQMESRPLADGGREVTSWFANGKLAKRDQSRPAAQEQSITEWFENGNQRSHADYRKNGLVGWQGWSSTGQPLDSDRCVEDADCVAVPQNVCYRCVPPYEGITRWREAQRRMHPPPPPTGCDPGPFPCMQLPDPPAAVCRASRCAVGP